MVDLMKQLDLERRLKRQASQEASAFQRQRRASMPDEHIALRLKAIEEFEHRRLLELYQEHGIILPEDDGKNVVKVSISPSGKRSTTASRAAKRRREGRRLAGKD